MTGSLYIQSYKLDAADHGFIGVKGVNNSDRILVCFV